MTSLLRAFAAAALLLAQPATFKLPPAPRGFGTSEADVVVDAAGVLSPATVARIDELAFDVHQKSGGEIAVATIADIGDRDPGAVALEIGRAWGVGAASQIGSRSRNAGVVILLVPRETNASGRGGISVTTGQGAEGFITDAEAGDIRREATELLVAQGRPARRSYDQAVEVMAVRVAQKYATEFGFSLDTTLAAVQSAAEAVPVGRPDPRVLRTSRGGGINPVVVVVIIIIVMILLSRGGRGGGGGRRRGVYPMILPPFGGGGWGSGGGWGGGGGGGGGGFGGFGGGGGFSGGGSSGSF